MAADGEWIGHVQRSALERALVDDVDARRYFALAGTLDAYRTPAESAATASSTEERTDASGGVEGVLPAAMVSVAVVPFLDDASDSPTCTPPSTATPATPSAPDPWSPGDGSLRPAIRRGARLALRWFDVSPARVAGRAGVPEATLVDPEDASETGRVTDNRR
jgi:hypothetical protein